MGKNFRKKALPHILLCNCSTLNFLIYEENLTVAPMRGIYLQLKQRYSARNILH
jgi:hypothetical protein